MAHNKTIVVMAHSNKLDGWGFVSKADTKEEAAKKAARSFPDYTLSVTEDGDYLLLPDGEPEPCSGELPRWGYALHITETDKGFFDGDW